MGWHNRLTLEQYKYLKSKLKPQYKYGEITAALNRLARKTGYGYTTIHNIYLSENYESYCKRTKGKYWYASEEDKAPKDLPHLRLNNRKNNDNSAQTLVIGGKEYKLRLSLEPVGGN